jgi:aminobenzoyl-glutamate utilization protein B
MRIRLFGFSLLVASATFAQTPSLDQLKKDAIANIDTRTKQVQEIVDTVFSFGELGFQEVETSRYLTALLEKNGFTVEPLGRMAVSR